MPHTFSLPQFWSCQDVRDWLSWCAHEYSLSLADAHLDKFSMNGKALLMLTRDDFCHRLPDSGDVIYNVLRHIASVTYNSPHPGCSCQVPFHYSDREANDTAKYVTVAQTQHSPHSPQSPCSRWQHSHSHVTDLMETKPQAPPLSPDIAMTMGHHDVISSPQNIKSETCESPKSFCSSDSACLPPKKRPFDIDVVTSSNMVFETEDESETTTIESETIALESETIALESESSTSSVDEDDRKTKMGEQDSSSSKLLWEFIDELLRLPGRTQPVTWYDEATLTFRITDKAQFAEMWGQQKQKDNMNYEKLSRALRYYYKMNIISKVPGKKLIYRFATHPANITKGIRGAKPGVPHKRRKKIDDPSAPKIDKTKVKRKGQSQRKNSVLDLSRKAASRKSKHPKAMSVDECHPSSTSSDSGLETDVQTKCERLEVTGDDPGEAEFPTGCGNYDSEMFIDDKAGATLPALVPIASALRTSPTLNELYRDLTPEQHQRYSMFRDSSYYSEMLKDSSFHSDRFKDSSFYPDRFRDFHSDCSAFSVVSRPHHPHQPDLLEHANHSLALGYRQTATSWKHSSHSLLPEPRDMFIKSK